MGDRPNAFGAEVKCDQRAMARLAFFTEGNHFHRTPGVFLRQACILFGGILLRAKKWGPEGVFTTKNSSSFYGGLGFGKIFNSDGTVFRGLVKQILLQIPSQQNRLPIFE